MHGEAHDARGSVGGILDQLLELIDRTVGVLGRAMPLDQQHREVVQFLRVGNTHEVAMLGAQVDGLVVEHPVRDILESCFGEPVHGIVRLGQRGAKPPLRGLAGVLLEALEHPVDHPALVRYSRQRALDPAVAHQVPV